MTRRSKMSDDAGTVHEAERSNGINEGQLKQFVAVEEDEQAEIDQIMENARLACQPHKDRQKENRREATEAGIPKKAFSAKIRERRLRSRADACRETLSEAQREIFDEISQKLGDLFSYADARERDAA